jgi:hypothetical protein
MSHPNFYLQLANQDGALEELAAALGFPIVVAPLPFRIYLREMEPLLDGWTINDAVLAYLDHLRSKYE